ncbi:MAG: DUF502 domain-containing protein [Gemmatimonadales bacterium]|jgi:uncharacterized membrane protein
MRNLLHKFRRYLITGLIVIAPIGVTVFVLTWLFQRLDPILGRFLPGIAGRHVPGLGLAALVVILVAIGWFSQRTIGRRALTTWNRLLERVPFARRVHSASAQIFSSVLERERLFQYCALIEFPQPGSWALVFETADAPDEIESTVGEPSVSVFVPTAPNPTSGYLLILPRSRVQRLQMSVEDGLKLVLSAGVARPARPVAAR